MACCPAHEDREPSLSITDAKGGKVLVRCHAGCDQRDVIAALRSRGIWDNDGTPPIAEPSSSANFPTNPILFPSGAVKRR